MSERQTPKVGPESLCAYWSYWLARHEVPVRQVSQVRGLQREV